MPAPPRQQTLDREVMGDARRATVSMLVHSSTRQIDSEPPLLDVAALARSLGAMQGRLRAQVIFDNGDALDVTDCLLGGEASLLDEAGSLREPRALDD